MSFTDGWADQFVLFPTQHRIEAGRARRVEFEWQAGRRLEAWAARSPGVDGQEPAAYLLEFTGNAGRAEDVAVEVAERWEHRRLEAWTVNYPGYGGSDGPARLADIPTSAVAAFDRLQSAARGRPIFVAGQSLGTTAALHVAASRPAAGVILQNPPPLRELILGRFGWWNLWMAAGAVAAGVPKELDSLENAKRVRAPGVFILCDADELVLPHYQQMVVEAYAGEKRMIPVCGGMHNSPLTAEADAELRRAFDWLLARAGTAAGEPGMRAGADSGATGTAAGGE